MRVSRVLVIMSMILCIGILSGCSGAETESGQLQKARFETLSDFERSIVGTQTGTVFDEIISGVIPNVSFQYYEDISGQLLALRNKNVDAIGLDEPVSRLADSENEDFMMFKDILQEDEYGFTMKCDSGDGSD